MALRKRESEGSPGCRCFRPGGACIWPMRTEPVGASAAPLWLLALLLRLSKLYGRDRPLAVVALDRNSQAVQLVKPDMFDSSRLSISQDDRFADQLVLRLFESGKNNGGMSFDGRHVCPGEWRKAPART